MEMDWDLFSKIGLSEFLGMGWTRPQRNTSPNVIALISHFGRISRFISMSILAEEKLKRRVKIVEKWIFVADHLRRLGCLNGVVEVSAGLTVSAIQRFTNTFDSISSQSRAIWQQIRDLTASERNWANARQFLTNVTPPCIPYIGLYLTDVRNMPF